MEEPGSNDPMKGQYGLLIGGEVRQNLWTERGELQLWITNKRKTRCLDCGAEVEAGLGIRLHCPPHNSGFLCIRDTLLRIGIGAGPTGHYRIDLMGNLGPAMSHETDESNIGYKGTPVFPAGIFQAIEVSASLVRMENGKPIKVE